MIELKVHSLQYCLLFFVLYSLLCCFFALLVAKLQGWEGRSGSAPLWFRLKYLNSDKWIAMNFCANIHGPRRMNPRHFISCHQEVDTVFNYWLVCHEIWYRHSCSSVDELFWLWWPHEYQHGITWQLRCDLRVVLGGSKLMSKMEKVHPLGTIHVLSTFHVNMKARFGLKNGLTVILEQSKHLGYVNHYY